MKCKICGHKARTLKAMGAHYRKKHPSAMKRRRDVHRGQKAERHRGYVEAGMTNRFCPYCGDKLA